ncbi:barstar family protein [Streptomyces sp. NPDC006314]|uniref:barstar family protein n=1 Tax=Streptomyces sp. NPDC006314 TaxID=3154475 RepID=UPI0033BB4E58
MELVVEGRAISSERDFHAALDSALDFGPYYGWNLDALWDRLTTDVARPVELVWRDSDASRAAMGDLAYSRLHQLLLKVEQWDAESGSSDRSTVRFE